MTSAGVGDARASEEDLRDGSTDEALYRAYAASQGQAEFTELVRRHSAMVRAVARRVTGGDDDADDVLQASFLSLANHARAGRPIAHLASWLHRVARNLSTHRRDAASARRRHERAAGGRMSRSLQVDEDDADPEAAGRIKAAMDQALVELPERYRQPLILHYLEGRSFAEIAHAHDTSTGTVASWLSRGRALLRARLARLGHPVSSATISLALGELGRSGGGADSAGPLDPALLGAGKRGAAIRDLATHAHPARTATAAPILLGMALVIALAGALWLPRAATQPAGAPAKGAQGVAPAPPADQERLVDLRSECLSFSDDVAAHHAAIADASAIVGRLALVQVGSWPEDQDDPWARPGGLSAQEAAARSGAAMAYVGRLARGEDRLPAARAGARCIMAVSSDLVARDQRWLAARLLRSGRTFKLSLEQWLLDPVPAAPDHRYYFLINLGVLPAGDWTCDIVEHVHGMATRRLHGQLPVHVAGRDRPGEGSSASFPRELLAPEPEDEPAHAYDVYRAGFIDAPIATAPWGLMAAGALPENDWEHAPAALASLPAPGPVRAGAAWRSVVIRAPGSATATTLVVRGLILGSDRARLIIDALEDQTAPAVPPRAAVLLVAFPAGPPAIDLEWHCWRRGVDGLYRAAAVPLPPGCVAALPVPPGL